KHEYEARNKINALQVPLEIKNYCKQVGETVGGSYQVTESCIRHEIEAKRNLDLESAPRNQANNQMPNQSDSLVGDSIKDVDSTGLMKGYKRYKNDRFGFTIDYPRNFIAKEPPQNGDGITLNSPDGRATLTVFGQNNSSGATVRQYYEMSIKETHSGSGYRKIKGNWYVITWKDSSNMLNYLKMFVGNGSLNGFIFRYPISQKIAYDDAVIRMEKSFMPGNLDQAW
ncbi:MAG: hypothetical protein GX625_07710, partial [Clostridiaceae bacterium]|nr:hypothetical protein [Clostridiaceae bacterium]